MGWMGRILRINLTNGEYRFETVSPQRLKDFIGGRGLGMSYLLQEVDANTDPLEPDNKLIMMTGPLTGTTAPTGARYMVITKSPLTGAVTCSNAGGKFPAMLKRTGIDGIIFEGKSPQPVYLWLEEDRVELRDARHLWGRSTPETDRMVRRETRREARINCIGPAGENGVLFAGIMNDPRAKK